MNEKARCDRLVNIIFYSVLTFVLVLVGTYLVLGMEAEANDITPEPPVIVEEEPIYETVETLVQEEAIPEEPASYFFDSNILGWDWDYVVRVVAAEAGLTADFLSTEQNDIRVDAQMAIAQCIKNTSTATGMTPEQVVKQPGQYTMPYRGIDDALETCNESCLRVFACGETITDEPIRYFYSTAGGGYSRWHENCLTFVTKIGPTKFFK